jgi:hypothetical protein
MCKSPAAVLVFLLLKFLLPVRVTRNEQAATVTRADRRCEQKIAHGFLLTLPSD